MSHYVSISLKMSQKNNSKSKKSTLSLKFLRMSRMPEIAFTVSQV